MIKLVYKDVAVGSKTTFTPTASGYDSVSHIYDLNRDNLTFGNYGTVGELNQTLLDSSQSVLPDDTTDIPLGLWSKQISSDDGRFESPITLTMTANGLFSSQGITLTFDTDNGIYATEVNIKWYNGSTLLHSIDFTPNVAMYFCS
ncbi:MAG: hypothetical protein HFE63_03385, partial [Clostridiales bacterium]|nr:hypothetical protein [Clostridiales bacterium]